MAQALTILTMYTLQDKDSALGLLGYLKPLEDDLNVAMWKEAIIDTNQSANAEWMKSLPQFDIFLLLVSPALMNSEITTQLEFKSIFERHKENKSVVIPIIAQPCQWAIDINVRDYAFNLNELPVQPDKGKPIDAWESPEGAYTSIFNGLKKILGSFDLNTKNMESAKDNKAISKNAQGEDQLQMGFADEKDVHTLAGKTKSTKKKQKPAIEPNPIEETLEEKENRLWEEAESKRRAEVAKQLREAAEASAKRRDEEDRLWEEAVAKRKAEKEQRLREEAANPRVQEERRIKEEAEAKSRAAIAKSNSEKAEAIAKQKIAEEQSRKKDTEAKKNAESAKRSREAAEATAELRAQQEIRQTKLAAAKKAEAVKRKVEEDRIRSASAAMNLEQKKSRQQVENSKVAVEDPIPQEAVAQDQHRAKGTIQNEKPTIKRKIIVAAVVAILAIILLWAFTKFNSGTEEDQLPLPPVEATAVDDPESTEATTNDTPNNETTSSNLMVGDTYDGGIVFEIDLEGKSGKIAHIEDAGPMPWNDAIKIHEQLGEGWRLPTFHELSKMYRNIGQGATNSGQFADELYWSATTYETYQARLLRFRDGNGSYHYNKEVESRKFWVRAIREFSR